MTMTSDTPQPLVYGKRLDDLDVLGRSRLLAGLGIRDVGTFLDVLDQVALPRGTSVIREGESVTYDMKPHRDDPTAVGTSEVADAIIEKLKVTA